MEPVLQCIDGRVDEPIMYQEAMRIYKSDRRTFPFLLVLGRLPTGSGKSKSVGVPMSSGCPRAPPTRRNGRDRRDRLLHSS